MSAQYQPLQTDDSTEIEASDTEIQSQMKQLQADPRFNRPAPSIWKRIALLLAVGFLFWAALQLKPQKSQPKVIHADRYSKEFKYRPAASPIITERLKDGVIRLRGAYPST